MNLLLHKKIKIIECSMIYSNLYNKIMFTPTIKDDDGGPNSSYHTSIQLTLIALATISSLSTTISLTKSQPPYPRIVPYQAQMSLTSHKPNQQNIFTLSIV